uniref:Uncharacterized protein n=1 Tax=Kalanchoe fedtschenkoi TaxID=63787 RepID=A0A7N0T1V5_KALFE
MANDEFPEGGLVSGGMVGKGEEQILKGHKTQVTGVVFDDSDIVSSSVDSTQIHWRKGQIVESWEAHNSVIQGVIKLPSGGACFRKRVGGLKLEELPGMDA